ncbi:hypothetical protein [Vibrio phage vB_VpaP_SJSY21]|nr:hypothetical protein [Vibrio phage vB_VpaP_SJSY21]
MRAAVKHTNGEYLSVHSDKTLENATILDSDYAIRAFSDYNSERIRSSDGQYITIVPIDSNHYNSEKKLCG